MNTNKRNHWCPFRCRRKGSGREKALTLLYPGVELLLVQNHIIGWHTLPVESFSNLSLNSPFPVTDMSLEKHTHSQVSLMIETLIVGGKENNNSVWKSLRGCGFFPALWWLTAFLTLPHTLSTTFFWSNVWSVWFWHHLCMVCTMYETHAIEEKEARIKDQEPETEFIT